MPKTKQSKAESSDEEFVDYSDEQPKKSSVGRNKKRIVLDKHPDFKKGYSTGYHGGMKGVTFSKLEGKSEYYIAGHNLGMTNAKLRTSTAQQDFNKGKLYGSSAASGRFGTIQKKLLLGKSPEFKAGYNYGFDNYSKLQEIDTSLNLPVSEESDTQTKESHDQAKVSQTGLFARRKKTTYKDIAAAEQMMELSNPERLL